MSVTPLDGFVLNGSEYEMRDKLAQSRIDNLVAQNNPTDGNTELLDIRVGADGHTYDSAGQAMREQIKGVQNIYNTNTVKYIQEFMKLSEITEGEYYNHNSSDEISTSVGENWMVHSGIDVYAGVSYYFYNLALYWSVIKYNDGTKEYISNSNSPHSQSKYFTPAKDGVLYITLTKSVFLTREFGLTNGERMWGSYKENYGQFSYEVDAFKFGNHIYSSNYERELPDFNNAKGNTIYNLTFLKGSTQIPLNSPFGDSWGTGNTCNLFTIGAGIEQVGATQLFVTNTAIKKRISNGVSYSVWVTIYDSTPLEEKNHIVVVSKDGTGNYESVVEASKYVKSQNDATKDNPYIIMVKSGTYDILEELGGSQFLQKVAENSGNRNGVELRDNVKLVGIGTVNLQLHIEDDIASKDFCSKISILEVFGNVTIENINLSGKNIRYCIHDETGNSSLYNNTLHKYKNVHAHHLGNISSVNWVGSAAYACGTSSGCNYVFENCIFTSDHFLPWSMHNNESQKQMNICIDGCIFKGKHEYVENQPVSVKFGYYKLNDTEDKAHVFIKNCVADFPIRVRHESKNVESTNIWEIHNFTDISVIVE